MVLRSIVYLIFFLVAWIFNRIAYRKSTDDWNKMLRSPYHIIATIIAYGSIGFGFIFLPELFDGLLSINKTGAEWIAAIITIFDTLIFLYIVKKYYYKKINERKLTTPNERL